MKNIIGSILMLLLITNAQANSSQAYVGANVNKEEFYIERNSIQKSGDSITFWARRNFLERTKYGDLSEKVQRTINCRTREIILRHIMIYDDINNNGKMTSNFNAKDEWEPIAPDSMNWVLLKFVCK